MLPFGHLRFVVKAAPSYISRLRPSPIRNPVLSFYKPYSAIWHAILDNFRPVSVWGTDLIIFYVITDGSFGEAWTRYSYLQFAGMLVRDGRWLFGLSSPVTEQEITLAL